jgi:uncharacterized membrane protein (DUF4010 family)
MEREWAHKELGSRTFPIVSLLGALAALISPQFEIAGFAGVVALIAVVTIRNLLASAPPETTTAAALLVTFALGVLAGEGHVFTPAAAAILMTLMLSLKPQLSRFALGLKGEEVRGAVLLALIGFVIYPALPNRFVDPWQLFNPREVWFTVILISTIGFVNYVLLRLFSARGLYYTALFGGLVNSTAAVAELAALLRGSDENVNALAVVNLLTIVSMFVRNLLLLSIFSRAAGLLALGPILVMAGVSAAFVWWQRGDSSSTPALKLHSPLELRKVASFGLLFVGIQTAGTLGQRLLGSSGILLVSVAGGLASSASSTAAAATLASHGRLAPREAAICTVLTSIASMLSNLPIVYRQVRDRRLVTKLMLISFAIGAIGGAVLLLEFVLFRMHM